MLARLNDAKVAFLEEWGVCVGGRKGGERERETEGEGERGSWAATLGLARRPMVIVFPANVCK